MSKEKGNKMENKKLMQCGHFWNPKRGVKTRGMCLECYKSYLNRLKEGRGERMDRVRRNVAYSNIHDYDTAKAKQTRLMAFFDAVMPEIPVHKALELSRQISKSE